MTSNYDLDAPMTSQPDPRAAATSVPTAPVAPLAERPSNNQSEAPRPGLSPVERARNERDETPRSRPPAVERARNERDETPRTSDEPSDAASEPVEATRAPWRRAYATRLWFSDLFVLTWTVYGTQLLWFGWGDAQVVIREDSRFNEFSYWVFSAGLVIAWMWSLGLIDSRDHRVIGSGNTEYVRVARASFSLFGLIAIIAFLFRIDVARGYLLIALPLGILVLLFERWLWRQWLIAQRWLGNYSARVLLVGSAESVRAIARELHRSPTAGYQVVGACVPNGPFGELVPGTTVPVMGSVDTIERALIATEADTVAVTSTDDLPPSKVKQISWSLESGHQHLVLAPSIIDVAGPRIHSRPVAGLPLIHVETPKFSRGQRFAKRTMDLMVSAAGLVLISPLLAFLALTVKLTSDGPVLFRQNRIGLKGREFEMLKFRSMVVNAEELLADVRDKQNSGNEILFKMADDPRVTKVGRFMRKYSLDELPQLFNVLAGTMSLVGPRPPLPNEVEKYAPHVHRRFLMKPGITGAWQVGGRSSLSWEDSVRLDLAYVENWSLIGDVVILTKTAKAALAPGATAS